MVNAIQEKLWIKISGSRNSLVDIHPHSTADYDKKEQLGKTKEIPRLHNTMLWMRESNTLVASGSVRKKKKHTAERKKK